MRRCSWNIGLMLLSLLAVSVPAEANWLAWLEEFSGAGPFTSNLARNRHFTFGCRYRHVENRLEIRQSLTGATVSASVTDLLDAPQRQALGTPVPTEAPRSKGAVGVDLSQCFYIDQTNYRADASRGFPAMKAMVVEGGVSLFFTGPFDLGAGGGAIRFEPLGGGEVTWQGVITPLRLQIRPLFMVSRVSRDGRSSWWRRLANAPKYYLKMSAITGTIDATQFGLTPQGALPETDPARFRTKGDLVTSYGFVVDYGELLGLFPALR